MGLSWLSSRLSDMTYTNGFALAVTLAFSVRLIPEILSYPYPIGFDTIFYAYVIKQGLVPYDWTSLFSTWLFEAIMITANRISQSDPFFLLKFAAPILFALNAGGIFEFAKKVLGWTAGNSFVAAFFFTFQLASMRLSWDLYGNMLGSAILLFTLPLVSRIEKKKYFAQFVLLSALLVFAHLLVAALLLAVMFAEIVGNLRRGNNKKVFIVSMALIPLLTFSTINTLLYDRQPEGNTNIISAHQPPVHPLGLVFLSNYLDSSDPVRQYTTYFDLGLHVSLLFVVLYLLSFPLVLAGFFRNRMLDSITLLLLAGSFSSLLLPFFALSFWNRWMFMLVYPFTFYATNGFLKVLKYEKRKSTNPINSIKLSRRVASGLMLSTVAIGALFAGTPLFLDNFGFFTLPFIYSYFPSTMQYNTIPLRDVTSTIEAFDWLNENMNNNSILLVHHAFLSWAELHLHKEHMMVYFVDDLENAISVAIERGFSHVYLIWWNMNPKWLNISTNWYDLAVPSSFKEIEHARFDRISVFKYQTIMRKQNG